MELARALPAPLLLEQVPPSAPSGSSWGPALSRELGRWGRTEWEKQSEVLGWGRCSNAEALLWDQRRLDFGFHCL